MSATRNPVVFKLKRAAYKFTINRAVNKSQKIIVPSNYVKEEITKTFKTSKDKIIVTNEAAEEEYFSHELATAKRKPFILYVGNTYPHKNILRLIDSLTYLKHLNLVLVCPRDVFWLRLEKHIKQKGLEARVSINGFLETSKLKHLFAQAEVYAFPSLSEGFGIPGLNAMAAGLPLAVSNIPVFREIYADAALYFNPRSTKDIATKINSIVMDKNVQKKLLEKEKTQVAKYSWQKMAKQTLSIYEACGKGI